MTRLKQLQDVNRLLEYCVSDATVKDNVVTLTRGDGKKFTIATKGKRGLTGDKGDSAYDLAVKLKKTNKTLEAWLESFKGATGDKGPAGDRGPTGPKGSTGLFPTFSVSATTYSDNDQQPSLTVSDVIGGNQTLSFSLPEQENTSWMFGMPYQIEAGEVTISEPDSTAAATLDPHSAYLWILNVTIPGGIQECNDYSVVAPDIKLLVDYDNVKEPLISLEDAKSSGLWSVSAKLVIPRGPTGDQGPRGDQTTATAKNATALFSVISDIKEIQDPGQGFSTIAFPCTIKGTKGWATGWSWRTTLETFQQVIFRGTATTARDGLYYRQGPPVGVTAESEDKGWIKTFF